MDGRYEELSVTKLPPKTDFSNLAASMLPVFFLGERSVPNRVGNMIVRDLRQDLGQSQREIAKGRNSEPCAPWYLMPASILPRA